MNDVCFPNSFGLEMSITASETESLSCLMRSAVDRFDSKPVSGSAKSSCDGLYEPFTMGCGPIPKTLKELSLEQFINASIGCFPHSAGERDHKRDHSTTSRTSTARAPSKIAHTLSHDNKTPIIKKAFEERAGCDQRRLSPCCSNDDIRPRHGLTDQNVPEDDLSVESLPVQEYRKVMGPKDFPLYLTSVEDVPVAAALVESVDLFLPHTSPKSMCKRKEHVRVCIRDTEENISSENEDPEGMVEEEVEGNTNTHQNCNSSSINASMGTTQSPKGSMSQDDQWYAKYEELRRYQEVHGDCLVPHNYKENLPLARWVKRQRHHMKQIMEEQEAGQVLSKTTEERVRALQSLGFIWNCQGTAWEEKLQELRRYRDKYSDCNVPSNFPENPKLGMWVKCQRRQYKLFKEGKQSSMTRERIEELEEMGFTWGLRNHRRKSRVNVGIMFGGDPR